MLTTHERKPGKTIMMAVALAAAIVGPLAYCTTEFVSRIEEDCEAKGGRMTGGGNGAAYSCEDPKTKERAASAPAGEDAR